MRGAPTSKAVGGQEGTDMGWIRMMNAGSLADGVLGMFHNPPLGVLSFGARLGTQTKRPKKSWRVGAYH